MILLLSFNSSILSNIIEKSSMHIFEIVLNSSNFSTQVTKFLFIWVIQVPSGQDV